MLTIKSQKIVPTLSAQLTDMSFAVSEDRYFGVFSLEFEERVSTQVVQSIITDTLAHTLSFGDAESGLSVLEKSLKDCREALEKIQVGIFNAVLVFFDADFVYVSIYGDAKALYLDGTGIAHVDTDQEGKYAGGTQKIEDGKVMVLCTEQFFKRFPPKALVSLDKPILAQDLDDLSSAVILKVDKLAEVKVGVTKETVAISNSTKDLDEVEKKLHEDATTLEGLATVANKTTSPKQIVDFGSRSHAFTKFLKPVLIVFGVIGLLIGVNFLLRGTFFRSSANSPGNQVVDQNNTATDGVEVDQNPQDKEIQSELTNRLDEANKVKRVQPQVFYDISITDAKTNPTELAQGQNFIAVSDALQGKIYVSAKDVTKFEELPQLFPGVKNLQFDGDDLVFTDNEGVKFYALATKSVNRSYLADENDEALGPSSEYLGFTYAVTGDKLVKFTKTGTKLTGALWSQKTELTNAVSVDIDGSIYVLFSDGVLEKYTAGNKDDFSIVGLDKPVQKPLKVVADADFTQIYVADGEEGRIVAFDADGVLEFQLKPELGSEWVALKSFDITPDEKTFYILSGTKVFEFRL